jgi:hypothetical protein
LRPRQPAHEASLVSGRRTRIDNDLWHLWQFGALVATLDFRVGALGHRIERMKRFNRITIKDCAGRPSSNDRRVDRVGRIALRRQRGG